MEIRDLPPYTTPVSVLIVCERCQAPICGHVFKRRWWSTDPDILRVPPHMCEPEKKGTA